MASERDEWLANLKPGDEVILFPGGWSRDPRIAKVERLTTTQVVLEGCTTRFRIRDGREVGGGAYLHASIEQPTPKLREKADRARLTEILTRLTQNVEKMPLATLREVVRLLRGASPVTIEAEVSDGE